MTLDDLDPDDDLIEDFDEQIHEEETEGGPPMLPLDDIEDFEQAIRGDEWVPRLPKIPPANSD